MSELTIYKLGYELMTPVVYKKGDIIFNDCSYMPEHNIKYIEMKRRQTPQRKYTALQKIKRQLVSYKVK